MLVHQKAVDGTIKLSRGMRFHLTPGDFYDISYGGVVNGHRSDGPHSWLIPSDRWEDIEDWHWACQLQQAQAIRIRGGVHAFPGAGECRHPGLAAQ